MRNKLSKPKGKLGVLIPGLGAVATTLIAGVEAIKKGTAQPIGSLSQMGNINIEESNPETATLVRDFVPLAALEDLVFGGWDVYSDNVYQAATKAKVLEAPLLESVRSTLEGIVPMKAVFDHEYVKNLDGEHKKTAATKYELAEQVMNEIEDFQQANECERVLVIWCGSTEKYIEPTAVHASLSAFEEGLRNNDPMIAPSMIYAYAALKLGIPFTNGAPNLTCDIPALIELSLLTGSPITGKDFKTGQTLMKTIIAPGLMARSLGVKGWFSTNILGNRDGLVLDDPDNFKTKEVSKLSVLEDILRPDLNPELYEELYHKIRINYYPPHGDNKESWDNIDIFGWLGYSMQIKVNFLCKDSILAAPIVLDLILFSDMAKRAGLSGIQDWLGFYFKSPQTLEGRRAEHDIFKQLTVLQQKFRLIVNGPQETKNNEEYSQRLQKMH